TGPPTEVASFKGKKTTAKRRASAALDTVRDPESPPPRPPFVPPPDLEGKPVPPSLRAIIEMALAKDPDRRYDTAGALARDLERYARGEPVQARPPGAVGRLWRRAKRRRVMLLLGAVLLLAPGAV